MGFERAAMTAVAQQMSDSAVGGLRVLFQKLDKSGDGRITAEEMRKGLSELGMCDPRPRMTEVITAMDTDGNGMIEFTEFVAASILSQSASGKMDKATVSAAFSIFDSDGNGRISMQEVKSLLGLTDCHELGGVDVDGDGMVSLKEFKELMGFGPDDA